MSKAKILTLQFNPIIGDKKANFQKITDLIEKNSWIKPDIVLLPEVFNIGVAHKYFREMAEDIPNGETFEFLSNLAKITNSNIIGGSFPENLDNKYKNTCCVLNRKGELLAKYSKIHMFSYYGSREGEFLDAGNETVVVNLDVCKVGLAICYDLRFPELFRSLIYNGAELIAVPAAWPYPRFDHWITLSKSRAIENLCYIVTSNHCGKTTPSRVNVGHSSIINPWGEIIASCGADEGVSFAEIDFSLINKIRNEFKVLEDRDMLAYANVSIY